MSRRPPSRRRPSAPPSVRQQRGAVLIIALVMLVLITIVSLTSIRATTTDEKLAGNARDRDRAFQAAEAVVRACLTRVHTSDFTGIQLLDPADDANPTPVWERENAWDATSTTSIAVDLTNAGLAAAPRCMIEELRETPPSYRVTGRAQGGSADTIVMLQATYSQE